MSGWSKLFSGIVTSSVWCEDDATVRVWIAMLATADAGGFVEGSVPGFANLARVSVEQMRAAIARLSSPDPDSRTPDHEGRRVEAVEGGWLILNYLKYRERGQEKEGSRAPYYRQYRARKRAEDATPGATRNATSRVARNTEGEGEGEGEVEAGEKGVQGETVGGLRPPNPPATFRRTNGNGNGTTATAPTDGNGHGTATDKRPAVLEAVGFFEKKAWTGTPMPSAVRVEAEKIAAKRIGEGCTVPELCAAVTFACKDDFMQEKGWSRKPRKVWPSVVDVKSHAATYEASPEQRRERANQRQRQEDPNRERILAGLRAARANATPPKAAW